MNLQQVIDQVKDKADRIRYHGEYIENAADFLDDLARELEDIAESKHWRELYPLKDIEEARFKTKLATHDRILKEVIMNDKLKTRGEMVERAKEIADADIW